MLHACHPGHTGEDRPPRVWAVLCLWLSGYSPWLGLIGCSLSSAPPLGIALQGTPCSIPNHISTWCCPSGGSLQCLCPYNRFPLISSRVCNAFEAGLVSDHVAAFWGFSIITWQVACNIPQWGSHVPGTSIFLDFHCGLSPMSSLGIIPSVAPTLWHNLAWLLRFSCEIFMEASTTVSVHLPHCCHMDHASVCCQQKLHLDHLEP